MNSRYHKQKREAFESFFEFAAGRQMPAWPLELFLEVSNVCDLKCAMCPTFSALNAERFLNLREIDRGLLDLDKDLTPLEEILEYVPLVHAHGYGEPTIHPQFRDFISYLTQFEVIIDFFTNGMHLTRELCDFLVEKRIARITVSASGVTKEDYENIYIGGKFETLMQGLANLRDAKQRANSVFPRVDVNSVGFKHHVQRFPEFVRMMAEHGVDNINLKPLSVYRTISELHAHRAVLGEDIDKQVLEDAKEIARAYGMSLSIKPFENFVPTSSQRQLQNEAARAEFVEVKDLKNIARKTVMVDAKQSSGSLPIGMRTDGEVNIGSAVPCMEPFTTMNVSYSGEVFPCCFATGTTGLTNIKQQPEAAAWSCDAFKSMRDRALENRYPSGTCGRCIAKSTYPKHHNVDSIVQNYSKWFLQSFGVPFHSSVQQQSRRLPTNREIIGNWSASRL